MKASVSLCSQVKMRKATPTSLPSEVNVCDTVVMPLAWCGSVPLGMPNRSIQPPVRGMTTVPPLTLPNTG